MVFNLIRGMAAAYPMLSEDLTEIKIFDVFQIVNKNI